MAMLLCPSRLDTASMVSPASSSIFADVPADHWAYDAVAQLVQDGVVNGYSADGTFKGDQNLSRYEMAQIVAKAMAKSDAADENQLKLRFEPSITINDNWTAHSQIDYNINTDDYASDLTSNTGVN